MCAQGSALSINQGFILVLWTLVLDDSVPGRETGRGTEAPLPSRCQKQPLGLGSPRARSEQQDGQGAGESLAAEPLPVVSENFAAHTP